MRSTIRQSSSRFTWPTSHPCVWLSVTGEPRATAVGNRSSSTENRDIRTPVDFDAFATRARVTVGLPDRLDIVGWPPSSMSVSSLNSGNCEDVVLEDPVLLPRLQSCLLQVGGNRLENLYAALTYRSICSATWRATFKLPWTTVSWAPRTQRNNRHRAVRQQRHDGRRCHQERESCRYLFHCARRAVGSGTGHPPPNRRHRVGLVTDLVLNIRSRASRLSSARFHARNSARVDRPAGRPLEPCESGSNRDFIGRGPQARQRDARPRHSHSRRRSSPLETLAAERQKIYACLTVGPLIMSVEHRFEMSLLE